MIKVFVATIILAALATGSYGQTNNLDGYYDNVHLEKVNRLGAAPNFIAQYLEKARRAEEGRKYYRAKNTTEMPPLQKFDTRGNELTLSHFSTPDLNTMDKPKGSPNWAKKAEFGFRF